MSDQFANLARTVESKTVLNKRKWFKQPMIFYVILFIILGTILSVSLAGTGNGKNETATVVFALLTFTGLLYVLYASSSWGFYGRCIEMSNLTK